MYCRRRRAPQQIKAFSPSAICMERSIACRCENSSAWRTVLPSTNSLGSATRYFGNPIAVLPRDWQRWDFGEPHRKKESQ